MVSKIKMSDDHSLLAFTLEVGSDERLLGGVKDLKTGKFLQNIRFKNIGQIEFGAGRTIFYTECDDSNRPYKVVQLCLDTEKAQTIFVDDDPTNYVDIGVTKDKAYVVISSNTKEDSEIWVIKRQENITDILPKKLVPRVKDVKAHIDHLRDFFVIITTLGSKNKNYKIATQKDDEE